MDKVCRTCTQIMNNEYFYLCGSIFASADLLVKDVLQICIPEMDVDLLPNSAICKNCVSALCIVYQFKTETIRNEKTFRSKEHIRVKNLDALSRNVIADDVTSITNEGDNNEGVFELELDNLDELKTEVVYEDVDDTNEVSGIESFVEVTFEEGNVDELIQEGEENVKAFDLVPISEKITSDGKRPENDEYFQDEPQSAVNQEPKLDVTNFIQIIGDKKMKRDVNRPYKCPECNFRTDAKANLNMHSRIHTGEKPFHCTKCPYRAKRKSHLEDHMKTHTGERPFRCTICDKSFITKQILKKHMLIHTGEKPYRCLQCNFRSRHKLTIANHVQTVHIGIKKKSQRSVCYICGKCLAGPASLSTHMKIHTGVKSHLCELCGRYFREKGMLTNHLRIHTGERPFTCTECNYMATRKAHLQEHLRTHNSERELLQCDLCDNRYTTKLLLRKHMNEEHQTELPDESAASIFSR